MHQIDVEVTLVQLPKRFVETKQTNRPNPRMQRVLHSHRVLRFDRVVRQ
jgi:hypothetical protein